MMEAKNVQQSMKIFLFLYEWIDQHNKDHKPKYFKQVKSIQFNPLERDLSL